MSDTHAGHCYCGAIRFEVSLPEGARPIFTALCHCESCRRAHAAPLYHVVAVDSPHFKLTQGAEHLVEFTKPGARITRAFCGQCGSRVLNRFPQWSRNAQTPVCFFPSLLEDGVQRSLPAWMRPMRVNAPDERVIDQEMVELAMHG